MSRVSRPPGRPAAPRSRRFSQCKTVPRTEVCGLKSINLVDLFRPPGCLPLPCACSRDATLPPPPPGAPYPTLTERLGWARSWSSWPCSDPGPREPENPGVPDGPPCPGVYVRRGRRRPWVPVTRRDPSPPASRSRAGRGRVLAQGPLVTRVRELPELLFPKAQHRHEPGGPLGFGCSCPSRSLSSSRTPYTNVTTSMAPGARRGREESHH